MRSVLAILGFVLASLACKALFLLKGGYMLELSMSAPHSARELTLYLLPVRHYGAFHWPTLLFGVLALCWLALARRAKESSIPLFWARFLFICPLVVVNIICVSWFILPNRPDFIYQFRIPLMLMDLSLAYLASFAILPIWSSSHLGFLRHHPTAHNKGMNLTARSVTRLAGHPSLRGLKRTRARRAPARSAGYARRYAA